MAYRRLALGGALILFLLGMGAVSTLGGEQYMLVSVVLVLASMLPFFIRFELKKLQAREVVLIAMLAAIASVSRVPFAPLPSVQPTSFVIIVSAMVFGAESGFMIGALAALVSNMFLGQGPWTPWQMFGWGMMGWTAGLLNRTELLQRRRVPLLVFGLLWGFLFGWLMNVWSASALLAGREWGPIVALYASSFYFDLAHALSNVFFLSVFAPVWVRILQRFKKKYGILSRGAALGPGSGA